MAGARGHRLARLWRHLWLDQGDARRAMPAQALERLKERVAASEQRHTGQVRICIEGALPFASLWRGASPRQRAVAMFGKLRVWDTEHNNGVLVYLLLADRSIEIVADRGLAHEVPPHEWQAIVERMSAALREGRFEDGVTQALEEASALLVERFPTQPGQRHPNELPDAPVLR
jgi:uncharacterized membrane protein